MSHPGPEGCSLVPVQVAPQARSLSPAWSQPGRDYTCSSLLIRLLGLTPHSQGIRILPLAGAWAGREANSQDLSILHIQQKVMGDTGLSLLCL